MSYITAEHFAALAQLRANDLFLARTEDRYYGLVCRCIAPVGPFSVGDVLIAVRGTLSIQEWVNDAMASIPIPNPRGYGSVGSGFWGVYASMTICDLAGKRLNGSSLFAVIRDLAKGSTRIWLTGHSLGAALATYLAADLEVELTGVPCALNVALFASPKPGTADFASGYLERVSSYTLVDFAADVVPMLPGLPAEPLRAGGANHNVIVLKRGSTGSPPAPELDPVQNHNCGVYAAMLRALPA